MNAVTDTGAGIVVVGGGIAAITAAHALREEGWAGAITIVADEPHEPYSRPALSKGVVSGVDDAPFLPPATHGARVVSARAVALDAAARTIALDDATVLPFDGLVIASGSRARDVGDARVRTLRGLDDARRLRDDLATCPDVVIVGGGALGMELASQCRELGSAVTLVSRTPPLETLLGSALAGHLRAAATERGVRFVRGAVIEFTDGAVVVDGVSPAADLVIAAIGDDPNVEWLATSGLLRGGELVVDAFCAVVPGIVAAGDVATREHLGVRSRTPLWTNAIEQAAVAARTLVRGSDGEPREFQPYFWTEQFGQNIKAVGPLPLAGDGDVLVDNGGGRLLRWPAQGTAVAVNHRIPMPRLRRAASGA